MKQLYIDFDGVILDTMTKSYEELKKENIDRKDQDKVMEFFRNLDWKKLIEETEEINDSINEIKKICDSKKFNVYILTHVNSKEEEIEKINYLSNILPSVNVMPTPIEIAKCNIVNPLNSVLVDDYSKNLILWKDEDGIPIKFSNEIDGRFITINNLKKLLELHEILNAKINLKRKLLLRTYR